jgi:hypothetical protein
VRFAIWFDGDIGCLSKQKYTLLPEGVVVIGAEEADPVVILGTAVWT